MKKEKLGFFKKMFLVITDFRTYPFLVKHEKFYKSFLYLITLIFVLSIILSTNMIIKLNNIMKNIISQYDEIVPEFQMSDGVLNVQEKYSQKLDKESYLVVNTDYSYEEYMKTDEFGKLVIYDNLILVNNDVMILENADASLKITYKDLFNDIDKDVLYEELTRDYTMFDYIMYFGIIYIPIFISYFITVLLKIIFLTFVISLICFFTGIRLDFKNYAKIAIYAYTLPLIIEIIATCVVGAGKTYTYYATLLLSYVYIIYAVRAVRLDAFIMMFSKKENLKHTPAEFEKELKKYDELMNKSEDNSEKNEDKKE